MAYPPLDAPRQGDGSQWQRVYRRQWRRAWCAPTKVETDEELTELPNGLFARAFEAARVEFTMAIDLQCDYAKANERKFQIEGKEVV